MRVGYGKMDKSGNINSQLQREIAKSPGKAVALGLLLLVAIWFWTPLVWGWIRPEESTAKGLRKAAETAKSTATSTTPAGDSSDGEQKTTETKSSWKEITRRIQDDPRMTPVVYQPGRKHPFDSAHPPVVKASAETQAKAAELAASAPNPVEMKLVVSSILLGRNGRAALINGKTYDLGSTIEMDYNGRKIEFQLAEIHDDGIVLRREGKEYPIGLPESPTSGRLEMTYSPSP